MSAMDYGGDMPLYYDKALGPVIFAAYAADIARRTAQRAPRDVLEIAAGTGLVTRELRNRLAPETRLTATDVSPAMLDVARAKFSAGEAVSFEIADAIALPFGDESFDAVVAQFGFMYFSDKATALSEAFRTLRPGGRHLFSVWDLAKYNPFSSLAAEVLKDFFPDGLPQFLEAPSSCSGIDPVKETLQEAGFSGIVISVQKHVGEVADAAAFARGLVFGSPLIDEFASRRVDVDAAVHALTQALARAYGENPMRYPVQAILFDAQKPPAA